MTDELRKRILALRGKKSFELIARELGITRGAVAGACFRADHGNSSSIRVGRVRNAQRLVKPAKVTLYDVYREKRASWE